MARKTRKTAPKGQKITASARKALDKLPVKKRVFTLARVQDATIGEAAAAAGVSRSQGRNYERELGVQAAYRELMRATFPADEVVELIRGGATATMPVYSPDGKRRKDRPDWRTRKPYIEMVREDAGYAEKKEDAKATLISVTVQHVGQNGSVKPVPQVATEAERTAGTVQLIEG